ncbi:MAG: hypothetical protein ACJ8F1_06165 [Polyangia bacterium]|jgi:hypothetical protein
MRATIVTIAVVFSAVVSSLLGPVAWAADVPALPPEAAPAEAPPPEAKPVPEATPVPDVTKPAPEPPNPAPQPVKPAPDPAKRFPRLKPPSLVHRDQFGLAVMPGSGYRIIAPYKDNIPCGQINTRVCAGRIPFFLDAQASFGFATRWDVIVDLRFGIEADFSQSHQFAVAPGVRYWVDADQPTKFFATFQGVYDLNPQHEPGVKDYDFGVRNANGFMFEVMRNLGFYLQFGETVGLVRWLRFEVDGGIGVQARFP